MLMKRAFDHVWRQMAQRGQADDFGGAEYRRVYGEWVKARCPRGVAGFIVARANIGPSGEGKAPSHKTAHSHKGGHKEGAAQ